ncbi:MAG: phosphonate ABC transporter, permease protein PhnE [Actinobacteria bacterium]|nr:phosphonate ABC transporter, permease protein PhnE [Actinomycetota bacterium]MCI0543291.1 phosphonate ABC transporter, permease protein PhnE [Actinomycetota bacterium]MCI0679021.1 phosphonate ABC transporter, permease protein PhnE [Actinomycetota bacterium]
MSTAIAADTVVTRPRPPLRPRVIRWLLTLAVLVPALWSAFGLQISWEQIRSAPADIWRLLVAMFPPDLSPEMVERALPKLMESLWIAWVGTAMGAGLSFLFAFAAATNVTSTWAANGTRMVLNAIRAVPELLVAMVLIPVTGLGAWTGALALGIHSIGTLGKLSAEVIEGIDEGPVEAAAATGGTRLQQIRWGMVPQVMPHVVAYWLYRFEINIRASAVLGVVGAGGIGAELVSQLRFRDFPRAGTVLFLTIFVVLAVDAVSARVRRRIISGQPEPGPIALFREMVGWQRALAAVAVVVVLALVVFILFQLQLAL